MTKLEFLLKPFKILVMWLKHPCKFGHDKVSENGIHHGLALITDQNDFSWVCMKCDYVHDAAPVLEKEKEMAVCVRQRLKKYREER